MTGALDLMGHKGCGKGLGEKPERREERYSGSRVVELMSVTPL
jgi:hypothetical protein